MRRTPTTTVPPEAESGSRTRPRSSARRVGLGGLECSALAGRLHVPASAGNTRRPEADPGHRVRRTPAAGCSGIASWSRRAWVCTRPRRGPDIDLSDRVPSGTPGPRRSTRIPKPGSAVRTGCPGSRFPGVGMATLRSSERVNENDVNRDERQHGVCQRNMDEQPQLQDALACAVGV